MSRYIVEKTDTREVVVGWDPPLGTFYAQEYGPADADDEESLVWWVGYAPQEIPTLAALRAQLLARGVVIPQDVDEMLRADYAAPWTPGPLQQKLGFTGKDG